MRRSSRAMCVATLVLGLLGVSACTGDTDNLPVPTSATPTPTPTATPASAQVRAPSAAATVLPAATPYDTALEVSRTLFASAPVVVVAPIDDVAAQLTAASAAVAVGAPTLLVPTGPTPAAVTDELDRLGAETVLTVGAVTLTGPDTVPLDPGADADALREVTGQRFGAAVAVAAGEEAAAVRALSAPRPAVLQVAGAAPSPTPSGSATPKPSPTSSTSMSASPSPTPEVVLPRTERPAPPTGTVALTGVGAPASLAAFATIRAAGVEIVDTPGGDPRATTPGVEALAAATPDHVVALGAAFGDPARLAARTAVARTGVLVGGGGQLGWLSPRPRLLADGCT